MAIQVKSILQEMIERDASDLHLKVGVPPTVRIDGTLVRLDFDPPSPQDMADVVQHVLTPAQREQFETTREVDFAFGELAAALLAKRDARDSYVPRADSAPYRQWGVDLDPASVQQLENACKLPVAARAALMPDAHRGYGLPIGGGRRRDARHRSR